MARDQCRERRLPRTGLGRGGQQRADDHEAQPRPPIAIATGCSTHRECLVGEVRAPASSVRGQHASTERGNASIGTGVARRARIAAHVALATN